MKKGPLPNVFKAGAERAAEERRNNESLAAPGSEGDVSIISAAVQGADDAGETAGDLSGAMLDAAAIAASAAAVPDGDPGQNLAAAPAAPEDDEDMEYVRRRVSKNSMKVRNRQYAKTLDEQSGSSFADIAREFSQARRVTGAKCTVQARVTKEERDALNNIARQLDVTASDLIRLMIRELEKQIRNT